MNNLDDDLARWLAEDERLSQQAESSVDWLAEFDPDRQAVYIKLGPFKRIYLRPQKFTQRFYHKLYPLKIESWPYRKQLSLFNDFCAIEIKLDLRFQATLPYVQRHSDRLADINQHIKHNFADHLEEIVNREIKELGDGQWVRTGLGEVENKIIIAICELLAMHQVQAQAICNIRVEFADFPLVEPGENNVYLNVLKKSYEITERKNIEVCRQQRLTEKQKLLEKQQELEYQQQMAELEIQAQTLEAEKTQRLLVDKQNQLIEQLALEKRIFSEKLQHEAELKEMQLETELRIQKQQKTKQRSAEIEQLTEWLIHKAKMEERKVSAEIKSRDNISKLRRE
ncbi:MAG: hypothetical protein ABSB19_15020, partial [Methylomonas sp.]